MGVRGLGMETQLGLQVDALAALDRRANHLERELVQMQNQVVRSVTFVLLPTFRNVAHVLLSIQKQNQVVRSGIIADSSSQQFGVLSKGLLQLKGAALNLKLN
eukprot:5993142-Pyramimonas_sp.AAC.4